MLSHGLFLDYQSPHFQKLHGLKNFRIDFLPVEMLTKDACLQLHLHLVTSGGQ